MQLRQNKSKQPAVRHPAGTIYIYIHTHIYTQYIYIYIHTHTYIHFFFSLKVHAGSVYNLDTYSMGITVACPGYKADGVSDWPHIPASTKDENKRSYISTPSYALTACTGTISPIPLPYSGVQCRLVVIVIAAAAAAILVFTDISDTHSAFIFRTDAVTATTVRTSNIANPFLCKVRYSGTRFTGDACNWVLKPQCHINNTK